MSQTEKTLKPKLQGKVENMKRIQSTCDDFVEVAFDEVGHAVFGEGGGDF